MTPFDYQELLARLLPHSILIIGALVALFVDQGRPRTWNARNRSTIAVFIGMVSAILSILVITRQSETGLFYNGMLQISPFTRVVQIGLLILTAGTLLIGAPEKFTAHIGEYVALILMAAVGLLLLAGTLELLTAFIALELTSLSLYLLTAFHKGSSHSAEAGLKYFLFGSVAAAKPEKYAGAVQMRATGTGKGYYIADANGGIAVFGGVITARFGPGLDSVSTITAWDPPHRFAADQEEALRLAEPLEGVLEVGDLHHHRQRLGDEHAAHDEQHDFLAHDDGDGAQRGAQR